MVLQYVEWLNHHRVVLASSSPRRLSILRGIGLCHVEVMPSDFEEDLEKARFASGADYALATATQKAADVLRRACCQVNKQKQQPVDILIAADTVVTLESSPLTIIEKAKDAAHARALLQQLSGQVHEVSTGLVIHYRTAPPRSQDTADEDGRQSVCEDAYACRTLTAVTRVHMQTLSEDLIDAYLATPAYWQGKAGAYGIQDGAGCFISGIEGDYYNVMGLPLSALSKQICHIIEEQLATENTRS